MYACMHAHLSDYCDFPLSTADELEMAQKRKQTETDERKEVPEGGKESEDENDEPALVNSKATRKEVQEESMKPEEDAVKTEVAEPASGKDGELNSNEGVIGGQKQEETNSVDEK